MAKRFRVNQERHMVVTPVVRLSFPQLFSPASFQNDPDLKKVYRCDLIFEKDQLSEKYNGKKIQTISLLQAINNAKADMWGPDKSKWPKMSYPLIKKGNDNTSQDGEIRNGYEGNYYITPKTGEKYPPKIVPQDLEEKDLYGGCYVRAQIVVSAYETGANKGVTCYLNQIMKVKDGERFGGVPSDVFDVSEVEDDSDDWGEVNDEGDSPDEDF